MSKVSLLTSEETVVCEIEKLKKEVAYLYEENDFFKNTLKTQNGRIEEFQHFVINIQTIIKELNPIFTSYGVVQSNLNDIRNYTSTFF